MKETKKTPDYLELPPKRTTESRKGFTVIDGGKDSPSDQRGGVTATDGFSDNIQPLLGVKIFVFASLPLMLFFFVADKENIDLMLKYSSLGAILLLEVTCFFLWRKSHQKTFFVRWEYKISLVLLYFETYVFSIIFLLR